MPFNLNDLVHRHNLDHLDSPFTNEEIMAVIKDMPTDRAPIPDGFNGFFMKKMLGHYSTRFHQAGA
jgi:hypothetical protein